MFENKKKIKKELFKLINTVVLAPEFSGEDFRKHHLSIKIPQTIREHLSYEETNKYLYLNETIYRGYDKTFNVLRLEKCLEYLNNKELDDLLKELVCEIHFKKLNFRIKENINNKFIEFVKNISKPIKEYEIVFGVDNLEADWNDYDFWECKITTLDQNLYDNICKSYNSYNSIKSYFNTHLNKPIIKITEFGNNLDLVFNRAKYKARLKLNALRSFINFQYSSINEKQTMFDVSNFGLLIEKETGKILSVKLFKNDRVWKFDWKGNSPEHIEDYNLLLKKTEHFSNELQNRINRTISWLGKAVQEENYDDKIVYLCTALETLLVNEKIGQKGERVAYRLMLFGLKEKKYLYPCDILIIYEVRSIIIHGSEIGIATSSHYSTLMFAIKLLLKQFIEYVDEKKTKTLKETISSIETDENLDLIKQFLYNVDNKLSDKIIKTIDKK